MALKLPLPDYPPRTHIALLFILLAGLALRLYRFAPPGSRADPAAPFASLPPGLDSDEAFHTLAALRLAQGEVAPFFKIDQGLPAAMIYLIALVFPFTGPVAEAGRIVSALTGSLMLLILPVLAWQLFPKQPIAGLVTAAQAAFTFWFVNFSRIGLEQMTAVMFMTLAVGAFWRWHQRGGWVWAGAAGFSLGVALYSYPAAYFLPPALALYGLYAVSVARPRVQLNWREAALAGAVLAFVAAPLVIFFILNPDWAARRSTQVAGNWAQVLPDYVRALGGLAWRGDETVRHNIPGRALLDPVQLFLFGSGVVYCLRRWREAPCGLLLIWLAVMLMPPTLSNSPEHFGRMAGAAGAIALLIGAGTISAWQRLPRWLAVTALGAAVIFTAARTTYDYFYLWPRTPGFLDVFDFPERLQAEVIAAQPPATAAYLTPSDRGRPMFVYLWGDRSRAHSFNGRVCTVFPGQAERETVWLVNRLEDSRTSAALHTLFHNLEAQPLFAETGSLVIEQLSVPAGEQAAVPSTTLGQVGELAAVVKVEPGPLTPGAALSLKLLWRVTGSTPDNWTVGLYLLDPAAQVRAQDDRQPCDNAYPTSVWQPGEMIAEERTLSLPADLPAGDYALGFTFYRLSDGERLPTRSADGTQATLLQLLTLTLP